MKLQKISSAGSLSYPAFLVPAALKCIYVARPAKASFRYKFNGFDLARTSWKASCDERVVFKPSETQTMQLDPKKKKKKFTGH